MTLTEARDKIVDLFNYFNDLDGSDKSREVLPWKTIANNMKRALVLIKMHEDGEKAAADTNK